MTIVVNWSVLKCPCPSWSASSDESALRSTLANLDSFNSSLHWWLEFWTWFVVFGVVLELAYVLLEYRDELHDFNRGVIHAPEKPPKVLLALGLLGAGLVAFGVSGEVWKGSQIATVETCIRKVNDALFLLLSKEAGDAATSAEVAHREADTVKQEADAIEKRLQAALKQIIVQGPRWVPLEANEAKFIKALKPFAGQRLVWVRCAAESPPEPVTVGQDVLQFLGDQGAGWNIEAPVSATWQSCTSGATSEGGNLVMVNNEADETVKAAAKALADALNDSQVYTVNMQTINGPKANQFFLNSLGAGNPWALAAEDPKAVFFLVGSNPTVDLQTLQKRVKARSKP